MLEVLKTFAEFIRNKPTMEALLFCLLAVIVYSSWDRAQQAEKAHAMVHTVIKEIREENQQNQDRLIFALKGVRYEVAKVAKSAEAFAGDAKVYETAEEKSE